MSAQGTAPGFSLRDRTGESRTWPSGRGGLLCFAKADCPTCVITLPLLEKLHAAFAKDLDVWLIAQDEDGGAALAKAHGLELPVLVDSELRVSHAFGIEAVPTVLLLDEAGRIRERFEGFCRADWQRTVATIRELGGRARPRIAWSRYPELKPGCGSRSVEPGILERLQAEAEGSPLRARRIEIADADDPVEFLFDQGLTDGLPVVPPTPERVLRMLAGTRRDAQEIVASVPPNYAPASVEKIAINAVMAGCRPEYLPVVLSAVEAVCSEEFNLHGVLATTFFATPVLIVNGPIRKRIGMNAGINCLGQGNRANAAIGRAVQLVVRNLGGGRPGEVDRATFGHPGKFTCCFAENEERSNWPPLHVERGFAADESTVTVFAGGAPTGFMDQLARDAKTLATSYGLALAATGHPKHHFHGEIVVLVPPEHVDTFAHDRWTKDQVREGIQAATARPVRELVRDAVCAEGLPAAFAEKLGLDRLVPKFRAAEDIVLVVAGGEAGKFGAFLQGWLSGPIGSSITTRRIEE